MSIEVFTTTSTLKCLLTTEFICYFSSATNTLRYMAVYSKYVQNYNLISGHIEVKMLKISKTIYFHPQTLFGGLDLEEKIKVHTTYK